MVQTMERMVYRPAVAGFHEDARAGFLSTRGSDGLAQQERVVGRVVKHLLCLRYRQRGSAVYVSPDPK